MMSNCEDLSASTILCLYNRSLISSIHKWVYMKHRDHDRHSAEEEVAMET